MHRLRPLGGVVVAGVVASGAASAFFLALADNVDKGCPSGLEGLGCGIAKIFALIVQTLVLQAVVNYGMLRLFRVERAAALAVVATAGFVGSWFFFDSLIPGGNIHPLPLLLPLVVLNVAFWWLLRSLPPFRFQAFVVATAALVAAWPLSALGYRIEHHRTIAREHDLIERADFVTYAPVPLPGFSVSEVRYREGHGTLAAYSEWEARSAGALNRSFYTVRMFRVPAAFNPPANCGDAQPFRGTDTMCSETGRTDRDEPIYVDRGATFSNVQTFFVRRGDTLITIETGVPDGIDLANVRELVGRFRKVG